MEMPDRDGHPWFAIERFIAGKDQYGASFVKHNTNSGFVDLDLHRVTPQVFSAHTFYSSDGTRLVADIQGVGDLFTDPQVLSNDYRFGDGDLGPRGMALFFKSFRHCSFSDSMGIPTFPLSRNELKHQAKYNDEEDTVSEAVSNAVASAVASLDLDDDDASFNSDAVEKALCRFAALDMNRMARQSALHTPMEAMRKAGETNQADDATEKRSNMATTQKSVSAAIRKSMKAVSSTGGRCQSQLGSVTSLMSTRSPRVLTLQSRILFMITEPFTALPVAPLGREAPTLMIPPKLMSALSAERPP